MSQKDEQGTLKIPPNEEEKPLAENPEVQKEETESKLGDLNKTVEQETRKTKPPTIDAQVKTQVKLTKEE